MLYLRLMEEFTFLWDMTITVMTALHAVNFYMKQRLGTHSSCLHLISWFTYKFVELLSGKEFVNGRRVMSNY